MKEGDSRQTFSPGDLVRLKTAPIFEERHGLIVKVHRNKLHQPVGYDVLVGNKQWFYKAVIAERHFTLVGGTDDADRSTGSI